MAINAMIPLGVQAPKYEDPMDQYAKMVGVQNAMAQNKLADFQYAEAKKAADESDAFKAALKGAVGPDGTINQNALSAAYLSAGKAGDYAKLQESQAGIAKNNAQAAKASAEAAAAHLTQLGNIANQANAGNWPALRAHAISIDKSLEAMLPEQYPGDETMKNWTGMAYSQAEQLAAQAAKAELAGQPFNPDGTPNVAAQKFAMDKAHAGASQIAVQLPGKGLEGLQGAQTKELEESSKTAKAAAQTLASVNQAREANAGGRYAGMGASGKAAVVDFLANGLGLNIDTTKLANTREFTSAVGAQLLAHAKALGANPSNADAARIEKILGNIDTDPTAMGQLLDWQEDIARRQIDQHNTRIQQVEDYARANKLPQPFAFDMRVQTPERWKPGASSPSAPASDVTHIWDPNKGLMQIQPGR